jgi:hypothetical protein
MHFAGSDDSFRVHSDAQRNIPLRGDPMTIERLPNLSARGVLLALVSSIACLAQSPPATVIGKFVGTWKENESKRKIGSSTPGLRFRRAAGSQLEELRGPDERPLVESVNFDSK